MIYCIASDFIINILLHFISLFPCKGILIFLHWYWFYINFYCIRKEYSSLRILQKSFHIKGCKSLKQRVFFNMVIWEEKKPLFFSGISIEIPARTFQVRPSVRTLREIDTIWKFLWCNVSRRHLKLSLKIIWKCANNNEKSHLIIIWFVIISVNFIYHISYSKNT